MQVGRRRSGTLLLLRGIKQRKLSLDVDESVLDWLGVRGYDPDNPPHLRKVTETV